MAAAFRRLLAKRSLTGFLQTSKIVSSDNIVAANAKCRKKTNVFLLGCAAGLGSVIGIKAIIKRNDGLFPFFAQVQASSKSTEDPSGVHKRPTNYRELRFRQFASIEHDGNIYMTPQDFLESLTEETPRARIGRTKLAKSEVDAIIRQTPPLSKGSDKTFRKLHDRVSASTGSTKGKGKRKNEPHSGFRIAFNMFDTDGNQIVDKREFLVLERFFILPPNERKFVPRDSGQLTKLFDLEKVFSSKGQSTSSSSPAESSKSQVTDRTGKMHEHLGQSMGDVLDTTLLIHFFGKNGKNVLRYQDFHRFMENLQSEVIELEFLEFSKGLNTISEVEFARVLLRYTNLDTWDIEECLDRVRQRCPNEKGITFEEFKKFCQFLNNLDDFTIAMKMYTFANQSVSQEEFQRAVKVCTGYTLGTHIVKTVFQIFDADGDGHLSHKEFVSIMKDRLHRGAKSHLIHSQNTWDAFKTCVKNEMKTF